MTSVGVYTLKANLSRLGSRAAAGEEVCVTRHGKPWFKLVPVDGSEGSGAAERELAQLEAAIAAVPKVKDLTPDEIREWIDEGREGF